MQYTTSGSSDIQVSLFFLGCMSFKKSMKDSLERDRPGEFVSCDDPEYYKIKIQQSAPRNFFAARAFCIK